MVTISFFNLLKKGRLKYKNKNEKREGNYIWIGVGKCEKKDNNHEIERESENEINSGAGPSYIRRLVQLYDQQRSQRDIIPGGTIILCY